MAEKLAACPFCGNEMIEYSPGQELYTHKLEGIKYANCPARYFEIRSGMIEDWNSRPGEQAARVKALEEVLSQVKYESGALYNWGLEEFEGLDSVAVIQELIKAER